MALSGPVRVHRWWGAVADGGGPVVRDVELPVETVVPNGEGVDHASAISLLGQDALDPDARLLVVYAGPAADRRPWPDTVLADRVRIGVGVDADLNPSMTDPRPAGPESLETRPAEPDPAPVELDVVDPAAALAPAGTLDPEPVDEEAIEEPADATAVPEEPPDGARPGDEPTPGPAVSEPDRHQPVDRRPATVLFPGQPRRFGT